ncbi:MAG: helix-turn-helix domain-containing protein [Mariniphaga sp.]|jgi:TolB-like protein/AraC-like DNA-binding protein|nr:helix-turn-helix domain-containing protein [Mariniphaga sp.]
MTSYNLEEQAFLKRLTGIVEANLSNEKFGVSELAQELGMNRSYVHRRLKGLTGHSVSHFIRKVRLEKAMEMLHAGVKSAAEIAYEVGFGSPAYFSKCFHEYFGFPPGEMKKRFLSDDISENEMDKKNLSVPEDLDLAALARSNKKSVRKKKVQVFAAVFVIICIAVLFYFLFTGDDNSLRRFVHPNKELSIIVLPFKNLTNDLNNQYFAEGITEDILNNLYWITSLRVVSRTSSEQFSESEMTIGEIARQMKVNYVLEGSVRKYENKTRISVQLIDAEDDGHLWSTNFDREMGDVIGVQDEIALQVASKLKAVLSENEVKQIEKIPTQNHKAYDYYLQARSLLHKANSPQRSGFNKAGAMNCIQYYEKAIAEDENFAEAYAGLASAWLKLSAWGFLGSNEGFLKGREFSLKALEIDPECAEAHSVLGTFLIWGQRKFDEGGKELQTSIRLNPNFATSRQAYAQFLMITGPIEEARKQVNHALRLEPYFWVVQNLNSWIYYFEEKYQEALEACTIAHDYNPNFSSNHWLFVLNYAKLGEGEKMMQHLQRIAKIYSGTDHYTNDIQIAFNQAGIEGLFYWLIELNKNSPIAVEGMNGHPFFIAWWNAILDNEDETVFWLEKVMDEKMRIYHYFNLICTNPDFNFLHANPRFIKIVDEIGLTPYFHPKK